MIQIGKVRKLLSTEESADIKSWKMNGEIIDAKNVVCTCSYFQNDTANYHKKIATYCLPDCTGIYKRLGQKKTAFVLLVQNYGGRSRVKSGFIRRSPHNILLGI